ncbi:MAG: hypothetical protein ACR2RE_30210 [Geminicoccaceae bacterium]
MTEPTAPEVRYIQKTGLERHFQTSVQIILVSLCGWMALTVHGSSIKLAEVTVQIKTLQKQVTVLQATTADNYTNADAVRDFGRVNQEVNDLKARMRALEMRRGER